MDFKNIKEGQIYYVVKNSTNGAEIKKVLVKAKLYGVNALLVVDENKVETKIYKDSIKTTLLTKEEAIKKFNEIKDSNPLFTNTTITRFSNDTWTTCWNCGKYIDRNIAKKCSICGWNKCPNCGSCQCNYIH